MAKKTGEKVPIILQAAKEIFAQSGYHQTSIAAIAKKAGIAEGTVYIYFENKEDILITLFETTIRDEFLNKLENHLPFFKDANLALYEIVRAHFEFFGKDRQLTRVIQIELRQTTPTFIEAIKPVLKKHSVIIEEVIRKGQEQGVFRKDISCRNARKLVFGTLDEMVTCWVLSTKEYDLFEMVEPAYKLFYQALMNLSDEPLVYKERGSYENQI
ncbi:TetR/AcrR family transcriptional regulator [Calidifontibacillus erzurumensis]|uniref:TetR/AcrR family transcriptional regulator n=1 Tax=Calidifontibacillus erzurumensis TaxID=2741433 RepID=A0A8J8GDY9_9BACI|nr:TetR/AcrR family transcriptional regulator [Calidifontibacillus erzurumensis]NSL50510.1 TetR/AcrR family transcriptional regulator [Calidifontibacillus erzurumensis]